MPVENVTWEDPLEIFHIIESTGHKLSLADADLERRRACPGREKMLCIVSYYEDEVTSAIQTTSEKFLTRK